MSDRESLDDIINELTDKAQASYNDDPLRGLIAHLSDYLNNYRSFDDTSGAFAGGYEQAIHDMTSYYLAHSHQFPCDCYARTPFPEQRRSGEWRCGDCGTLLAESADDILSGGNDA